MRILIIFYQKRLQTFVLNRCGWLFPKKVHFNLTIEIMSNFIFKIPFDPIQNFWKLHGKSGVTDISLFGENIYSTGRDGVYRKYVVHDGKLKLLANHKV
jgi:hypothetical protein